MKKLFFLLMLICSVKICSAQFYDDEDEIYFYVDENDRANRAFVFNFDGNKAALLNSPTTLLKVKNNLKKDANYFEKKVFTTDYKVKYNASKSTGHSTAYTLTQYWPYTNTYTTSHYIISNDRETLDYYDGNKYWCTMKRVDKSYFMPGRQRKNLNDDSLYE